MRISAPFAVSAIESARRRRDVERDAVMLGGECELIGADLVRDVAVHRDPIRADDAQIDFAVGHERRRRAVDEHRHWNSGARRAPTR